MLYVIIRCLVYDVLPVITQLEYLYVQCNEMKRIYNRNSKVGKKYVNMTLTPCELMFSKR